MSLSKTSYNDFISMSVSIHKNDSPYKNYPYKKKLDSWYKSSNENELSCNIQNTSHVSSKPSTFCTHESISHSKNEKTISSSKHDGYS